MDTSKFRADFVADARSYLGLLAASLEALAKDPADAKELGEVLRAFHTLRSTSATMSYREIASACAAEEKKVREILGTGRAPSAAEIAGWSATLRLLEKQFKSISAQ